jgi:DNA-directed RNA polymerase specialized sigma24 family protein
MTNEILIANSPEEDPAAFGERFWRSYGLLHFIACRVLGSPERADDAIENCWLRASRSPLRFEHKGAFRSWLFRVLIDEALAILRENQASAEAEIGFRRESFEARPRMHEKRTVRLKIAQKESTEYVYPAINENHRRT